MLRTKLPPLIVIAMLVLTAFATVPVAAADERVTVETEYADEIDDDSATLHGNLTALENATEATVWFEYWKAGDEINATNTTRLTVSETGPFHGYPEDLESNTTYVFVAHATTENASAIGSEATFTTEPDEHVEVVTEAASAVTNDSATLEGELTVLRSDEDATVWFEYWTANDPDNTSVTAEQELDEPGAFTAIADELEEDTTYVFVAHASAGNASASGDTVEFETESGNLPLGVETDAPTNVENTSATLAGELTGLGDSESATVYFEYWAEDDRENSKTVGEATFDEPRAFEESIEGLDNGTTYVYVAHARTDEGEVVGNEIEFTTAGGTDETIDDPPSWDGEGPFGQWLTSWLKNLLPQDTDEPFGQLVAELVHQNNPGSDKRSEKANPGGNGNGPPNHAGPSDDAEDADDEDDEADGDDN